MVQGRTGTGGVVPLMVRVPEDLRDRIKVAADANGRSQNSEIVATLEEKYPQDTEITAEEMEFVIELALRSLENPVIQRDLSARRNIEEGIERLRTKLAIAERKKSKIQP